jgi:hypothetical protein
MNRLALATLAAIALSACPPSVPTPDGGEDAGGPNPNPMDACSGGCAPNQICDTVHRVCIDGCGGCGSDGGSPGICVKTAQGTFQCQRIAVNCSGNSCDQGQVACIGGACTCLGPSRGTFDTCFGDPARPGAPGEVCVNGSCKNPKTYQQCVVGGAACPTGDTCQPVFGASLSICTRKCTTTSQCDRGEICSSVGCLPSGLFNGQECAIQVDGGFFDDGGAKLISNTVAQGSVCLRKDEGGNFTETVPTGTCTDAFFYFANQGPYEFPTCRPPGGAAENTDCKQDPAITAQATQCGTGLECALMRGADLGICLRSCNALEASRMYPNPLPRCAGEDAGELCINLYKLEDINQEGSLMGVCTKQCNVFDPTSSHCAAYGSTAASCVPTDPAGKLVVTPSGDGVCLPQQPTVAQLGQPCTQSDPFHGAVCATGQICPPQQPDVPPVCTQVCDTSCASAPDGGALPARCATEVNSTCPGGKTCTRVSTTLNARLGFCL